MPPVTPTLATILELEDRLQAAWGRSDAAAAADIRARLVALWAQRRTELAAIRDQTPSIWDSLPTSVRRS